MLRRLYEWTLSLAAGPKADRALFWVAFTESSFFPLPPDVLLVPMTIARPDRAYYYAILCGVASTLGGLLGYAIGALLYDSVGLWIINLYGYGDKMEAFRHAYAEYGLWIILLKGLTPIPYKLVTIVSGFAGYNVFLFVVLTIISRTLRFLAVAWLLKRYGEPVREFIEKRLEVATILLLAFVVGGFVLVKYVV
ncbi:YqaA family protein [Hansschlegelia beijingensis]|uniref:Membrane protein YqaA with SNARE-associated domain n=1 Tax=Hansschlegelia beijingensis TaxID=1133344 RepID=A0A7W6CZA7_9HYPH|nr:YqaA family protein [Hansschlegelia beijingensis]MBB3973838.1 membrane protein YqaA with SNARE-associated domain [Hansschlegelia beijingensis]